ncbi:diguanylate cyclase domain-containing protein [Marinospirillum sp.]|uniref:diguanylate cyclase domain-containing protein n=1 Tax=Marinospirillum sp. TaxID=2183934 RepID=UPI0028708B1C|nr:diguanylate cyclase [Marinospirillum sp.]MDR9469303.1 diguanylate cyclase [Marinospirillum sp.]
MTQAKRDELWLQALNQAQDACFLLEVLPGLDFRVAACNPAFARHLEQPFGQQEGRLISECFPEELLADLQPRYQLAAESREVQEYDTWTQVNAQGVKEQVNTLLTPIFNAEGQLTHLLGIARLVTSRRLEESYRERWYKLSRHLPGVPFELHQEVTGQNRIPLAGPKMAALLGLKAKELKQDAQAFFAGVHAEDQEDLRKGFLGSQEKREDLKTVFRFRHPVKGLRWIELHSSPEPKSQGGTVWYGYLMDVTERHENQANLHYLATHDTLTELPNRGLFLKTLEQALQKAKQKQLALVLLFMDLDKFKPINDELGHKAGDRVLKDIALRIGKLLPAQDMLARLGGDEFIVLMTERDRETAKTQALDLADEIINVVSEPLSFRDGESRQVGVSIGISLYPEHGEDADTLIVCSDDAMYAAKHAGRGRARVFDPELSYKNKPHR